VAQSPGISNPYPANDSPLTLPSGTTVRQRNFVVFRCPNASALTLTIETPTAATAAERVAREAQEVAMLHDEYAHTQGITRITVGVCRSQACLELREVPAEIFHFVRAGDGTWLLDHVQAP
jgi:hypothetical protein